MESAEDTVLESCMDVALGTWVLNDVEHFLGESAAAIPVAHITMKVEPISRWVRRKSSGAFGWFAINKIAVKRPNSETDRANFISKGGLVSVFMGELLGTGS